MRRPLNYHVSVNVCRNGFSNLLKKRNRTAIPLIQVLIPTVNRTQPESLVGRQVGIKKLQSRW